MRIRAKRTARRGSRISLRHASNAALGVFSPARTYRSAFLLFYNALFERTRRRRLWGRVKTWRYRFSMHLNLFARLPISLLHRSGGERGRTFAPAPPSALTARHALCLPSCCTPPAFQRGIPRARQAYNTAACCRTAIGDGAAIGAIA